MKSTPKKTQNNDDLHAYLTSKEYKVKILDRAEMHENCKTDPIARNLVLEMCKRDTIFFINNFLYTYDPRKTLGEFHLPFILFDFQEEIVTWLEGSLKEGVDGLIEKSRDMGLTWIVLAVLMKHWLFDETFSALVGSRKEEYVDNRMLDSHFGKFQYMLEGLPEWMVPQRFAMKKHRNFLKLINPENQNTIKGESSNKDFGRAGRYSMVFMDEFAYFEYADEAWTACGDSTPVRMAVSTPNGANKFKRLRFSKQIDVQTVHWSKHPFKDQAWYENEKSRRTEHEMAQELDISYDKSVMGRVYPEWDEVEIKDVYFNPNLPLYTAWDFGRTDDNAIIWFQREGDKHFVIDAYSNHGKKIDFYVPFITGIVEESELHQYSEEDLQIIASHKNWGRSVNYGDPDMLKHFMTSEFSILELLESYGIPMSMNTKAVDFESRKLAAKKIIPGLTVDKKERLEHFNDCMINSRYPERTENSQSTTESQKPIHNWASHFRSAFEYYAVNVGTDGDLKIVKDLDSTAIKFY